MTRRKSISQLLGNVVFPFPSTIYAAIVNGAPAKPISVLLSFNLLLTKFKLSYNGSKYSGFVISNSNISFLFLLTISCTIVSV